jgi:PAS domain S-box-containing protein
LVVRKAKQHTNGFAVKRRSATEERLRFLTLLLDAVEQSVIATDLEGRILYWNRFAEELYGWDAEEAVGRNIADLLMPPSERDRGRAAVAAFGRQEPPTREWRLRRRDGTAITVHASARPILDDAGNIIGIVGVSWDISEKKTLREELQQSESRLQLIAEQLPAAVWATDADLKIVWNQSGARMVLPASLIGKTIAEAVSEERRKQVVDAHQRALRGETATYLHTSDFGVVQAVVQPFRNKGGTIAGTIGLAIDITGQKRVADELFEKRRQLESLSRRLLDAQEAERRALARELHDAFGQVLTAIRLNLEAAKRSTAVGDVHYLNESIKLVDQAVDQVRNLATDLRPALLDDLGLVAALRSLLKRLAQGAGFDWHLVADEITPRLPTIVETCSFRLAQEALTNVAKHARATSVDVGLSLADDELRIVVRDNGVGFDIAAIRQPAALGTSFGLVSMQERVTLAGGTLEIRSAVGQGTIIDARLPLAASGAQ